MTQSTPQNTDVALPKGQRLQYLDNAKGLASLLGIFFHASLVYSYGWWWINSPPEHRAPILGYSVNFITYFHMPLFIFVAGYFTSYGLRKYGSGGFLIRRASRIGVPFVASALMFLPFQLYLRSHFKHPEDWRSSFFGDINPLSDTFSFSHLWFLYFLIISSVLFSVGWRLASLLPTMGLPTRLRSIFCDLHKNPWGVVACWFPINLGCSLMFICLDRLLHIPQSAWLPLTSLGALLPILLFGFACQANPIRYGGWLNSKANTFLLMFCVLGVYHFLKYEYLATHLEMSYKAELFFSTLFQWVGTIAALGLIRQYLNYQTPVMRYISDASYPVYLFHHPIVILISFFLVSWWPTLNPYVGYFTVCLLTIIFTYAAYELVIRRWKTGRFLFTGMSR